MIVIDEAGMVGNEDYLEILRVAASKQCTLILAGDEKQLASITRGGMFEIFAKEFGSIEMSDIKRQKTSWGIALSFSEGNVKKAINILRDNNRLHISNNKIDSMELLLNNWDNSTEKLENRLIIGVKNTDVDSLNIGARELLKSKKILNGTEIAITKNNKQFSFMKNDRIVFTKTNKELGINNGDFATLTQVSDRNFIVKFDNGTDKSFNPKEFNDFKHGYASTIYKAQGASIKDVHVFHDSFSTNKNSYVAMSRHENNLNLYINNESTKTDYQLIKQLSFNIENQASINYYTEKQLNAKTLSSNIFVKTYEKLTNKIKDKVTNLFDKYNINDNYYVFETSEINNAKIEKVLDSVDRSNFKINEMETKKPSKQEFYANRDYHLSKSQSQTIDFKYENDKLRNEAKYHAENIARDILNQVEELK